MKRILLFMLACACTFTGVRAITIGTLTDGAVTISDVSAGELASADLSEVATATKITITGTLNDSDLQALATFASATLFDLSDITVAEGSSITSARYVSGSPDTGARQDAAMLLPTGITNTEVNQFQQSGNTIAFFTATNKLSVYSERAAVANLAPVVTTSTSILLLPKYESDGTQDDTNCYLTPYPSIDDSFITHLGSLPAASIDMKWLSASHFTNMKDQLANLNVDTHYLVVPSNNSSSYNSAWDPTTYTYSENTWAVSTYFGTAAPYSTQGDFGGRQYTCGFYSTQTGADESAQTANFTQILSSGHLSDIFSYMSDEQKSAGVSAFYGTITSADMATLTSANCSSTYLDFSRATFSGTTIADLPSTTVKYIELPYSTDITTLSASDFKSNVKEAVAVDKTNGDMYGYSSTSSNGTLEHLLAYDTAWKEKTDETFNVHRTLKLEGMFNDVFGQAHVYANANQNLKPTTLDLSNASFPSFTSNLYKLNSNTTDTETTNASGKELYSYTGTYSVDPSNRGGACEVNNTFTCEGNGLANINTMSSTLTSIQLPTDANTTTLPSMSFYNCSGITGELTVPANYKTLGASLFIGCSGITTLNIQGATLMGLGCCSNMAALATVNLPSTLEKIPDFCFNVDPALKVVDLPEGIKTIGIGAFKANSGNTTQIEAIRFPSTLERIECEAFVENHHLTVLSFPANLKYIGTAAFTNCQHIMDVYFLGETPPVVEASAFDGRTTGQGQGRTNDDYKSDCSPAGVSRYYYTGAADATTASGFADIRAILHYPIVKTETTYAETSVNLTDYNAALAAPVTLYYLDNEEYVEVTGAPETGVGAPTYYAVTPAATTTLTTKPVANVWTYYSDSEGTSQVTPPLLNTTYWYKSGEETNYTQIDANSAIGSRQYYLSDGTPTDVKLGSTWYYQATEASEVVAYTDIYNEYWSSVSSKSPFYTSNDGTDVETTPTFDNTYYYTLDSGSTWLTTNQPVAGVSSYYSDQSWSGANPQINSHTYYKTVTSYAVGDWVPTTTYVYGRTYSTSAGGTVQTPNWYNVDNNSKYYYEDGTRNVYSQSNEYVKGRTYYTNNDGTGEVAFADLTFTGSGYYYYGNTYTEATSAQIANAEVLSHTLYYKDGDNYVKLTGSAETIGTTYYEIDTEGSDDKYGDLYTVPARNNSYKANGGFVALNGDTDGAPTCDDYYYGEEAYWPTGYWLDADQTYGDSPYAGVKQFLLVAGYEVTPEDPTPVQTIDHITKDVWYTVCFPFDLSEKQLVTTFGPNYELAEFSGVAKRTDGTNGIILQFHRNPDEVDGVKMKKHKAYMIHPASGLIVYETDGAGEYVLDGDGQKIPVLDSDGKTIPAETSFTLVGIEETEEDHNYTTKQIFDFNFDNGNAIVNPGKALSGGVTGNNFVFTAVSHSNYYDFENNTGTRVLLPQWCYFLGTAAGATYPKFYRQAASDAVDRTTGLWRKNVAVVLPPATTYTAQGEGDALASGEDFISWKSGFSSPKYIYQDPDVVGGAKYAFSSFEIMFVDEVDAVTPVDPGVVTGIEEVSTEADDVVPAHLQGRVYSISGQYVGTSLEGLQKGVYIVNGKKYLVK